MAYYDEAISAGINKVLHPSAQRLADTEAAQEALRSASRAQPEQRASEIAELCSKFAIWGTQNHIAFNSPSILADGWLLGEREFDYSTVSHQGDSVTSPRSMGKLLVAHSGIRGEIIYSDDTFFRFFSRKAPNYSLFPHKVNPAKYDIKTIIDSIVGFGVLRGADWQ